MGAIQKNPCPGNKIIPVLELIGLTRNRRPVKDELISIRCDTIQPGQGHHGQRPAVEGKDVIGGAQHAGTDRDRIVSRRAVGRGTGA